LEATSAEAFSQHNGGNAKRTTGKTANRISKVRMVKNIEEVGPKLKIEFLS
jgi:hypothetical protein